MNKDKEKEKGQDLMDRMASHAASPSRKVLRAVFAAAAASRCFLN